MTRRRLAWKNNKSNYTTKMSSPDVDRLPDEIMLNVMRWLPTSALVRMALVSKNNYRLVGDSELWKEKILRYVTSIDIFVLA